MVTSMFVHLTDVILVIDNKSINGWNNE